MRFTYKGKLYQYTAFPNGLSICPRKFTKLIKPVLAHIHTLHRIISGYIDDFYLQGTTYKECIANVIQTVKVFDNVGLVPHPDKSTFIPVQEIVLLGFVINSIYMTIVKLKPEKIKHIYKRTGQTDYRLNTSYKNMFGC